MRPVRYPPSARDYPSSGLSLKTLFFAKNGVESWPDIASKSAQQISSFTRPSILNYIKFQPGHRLDIPCEHGYLCDSVLRRLLFRKNAEINPAKGPQYRPPLVLFPRRALTYPFFTLYSRSIPGWPPQKCTSSGSGQSSLGRKRPSGSLTALPQLPQDAGRPPTKNSDNLEAA